MHFEFMTREVWDALILAVILIGGALAAVRLYRDLTRPLPEKRSQPETNANDIDVDTKPHVATNQPNIKTDRP